MDEKLRRAFELAFFIHPDADVARRIALEALSTLDVALAAQDKRLYYAPGSRSAHPNPEAAHFRTKVALSELQLLQRLVYIASETEERRKEQEGAQADARSGLDEATLLVYYLKHLVRITLRRNSFYVTLGLSRLLHNYSTPETMQIYELIVQDPARGRDDSYYRRRKAQLMEELKERFGARLNTNRVARGEERFQSLPASHSYAELIAEALRAFTPWQTRCVVPASFDPFKDELPPLRFRGHDPDAEHKIEVSRFHAVLHPDCYEHLLAMLRLDAPDARLELPQFAGTNGAGEPPRDGDRTTAALGEEEAKRMAEHLAAERKQRKRFAPTWLRVAVDGRECARLNLRQAGDLRFTVSSNAELIEVFGVGKQGELRMAAHLLSYDEDGLGLRANEATLTLEGGQALTFIVEPAGESADATVALRYRETQALRAAQAWLRRLTAARPSAVTWWKPALTLAVLALIAAVLIYFLANRPAPKQPEITRTSPTPTPAGSAPNLAPDLTNQNPSPTATPRKKPSPLAPEPAAQDVAVVDIPAPASEDTGERDIRNTASSGLLGARKLYLDISGSKRWRPAFEEKLKTGLAADGRFTLSSADDGDVSLLVAIENKAAASDNQVRVMARVTNAAGKVLWPLKPKTIGRQYRGAADKIAERILSDLFNDIRQLENKRK